MSAPPTLTGVFAILATTFADDESLDAKSLGDLVEWELAAGVAGITILGIFGEAHRLTEQERLIVTRTVVERNKCHVPVFVGASHASTYVACTYAKEAEYLGADGLMLAPSPFSATPEAIVAHYRAVGAATHLPIVVQDEPAFTGVKLSPNAIMQIAESVPTVVAVKLEEPPTPPKVTDLLKSTPTLSILGGLGGVFFLEELDRGAHGTMTGFAFPERLVQVFKAHRAGRIEEAKRLFFEVLPLLRYESQPQIGLAIRKEILMLRGAIRTATLRQPARTLDERTRAELHALLKSLALVPQTT